MISSKANVILMDKNKLEKEFEYVLGAEEKIELTLRRLKWHDNVKFSDVEVSLELTHAVIAYIKSLNLRRGDKRNSAIENIKTILDTFDKQRRDTNDNTP